jgi:Xaa-Pro aminopeptidase
MTECHASSNRLASLRASFDEHEIDAMLVTDEINVRYLSGFTGDSSYLIVTPDDTCILSDGRYTTQLAQECPELRTAIRLSSKAMIDLVAEQIGELGPRRIGFEASTVSVAMFNSLQSKCTAAKWKETVGMVERLRMVKDAGEIALIRRAIDIAERAYRSIVPKLRPNWTELEIAHELESTMRLLGAESASFAAIIGSGVSGALPHYRPRPVTIADSASLLMDFGAKYKGYASDITRTLGNQQAPSVAYSGRSSSVVSDRFKQAHAAVLEAQLAAIDVMAPGVPAKDVDAIAREVLAKHGLADAFVHGLGHGIGLQIHESPRMSALSQETLAAGMVITVEPGVYFEGEFGIRIEDDVLVTDGGREVLSSLGKGLDDCPILM